MPQPPSAQVTAAEISRIAGVTRATVSNWRRRHEDFPTPSGGTESSPLYDLEAVRAWLESRGQTSAATPAEELRTRLRLHPAGSGVAARLLPLVLAVARPAKGATALRDLPDAELVAGAGAAVADIADSVPGSDEIRYGADDTGALRALLRCVDEEGATAALDVLAERELEDSAASGTYLTPEPLSDLMARLLPSSPPPSVVLDPACGSGSLLAAAARHGAKGLYGQDSVPVQARRAAVRLRLDQAGAGEVGVRIGDSLRADAFPDLTADAVLSNPPYGVRDWGHEELAYDARWAFGLPARAESELAWVQHALAHLPPGGHAVLLLPPATAARPSGRRVRGELIRSGALRAVAALPAGAAAPLHIGLHIWVLQRPQQGAVDRTSVLFVDTASSREETSPPDAPRPRRKREALDWQEVSGKVLRHWDAFRARPESFTDEPGVARAVPVVELLDELVDVTPSRHVRATSTDIDPAEVARRAQDHLKDLGRRAAALADTAVRGPWPGAGTARREWRTAAVSDLARGGALEILRAGPPGEGRPGGGRLARGARRPPGVHGGGHRPRRSRLRLARGTVVGLLPRRRGGRHPHPRGPRRFRSHDTRRGGDGRGCGARTSRRSPPAGPLAPRSMVPRRVPRLGGQPLGCVDRQHHRPGPAGTPASPFAAARGAAPVRRSVPPPPNPAPGCRRGRGTGPAGGRTARGRADGGGTRTLSPALGASLNRRPVRPRGVGGGRPVSPGNPWPPPP
ncbi:predicted protein [Streptomyces pristinaespiralis ATCC 25486]|uniref:Predicted protein n=1 Tax=Streptomyces pristinaespiralis (strain ATCC 25486 / DSM 40338 / CBS 914.69 / JCM 4507 / KCC S-0507 / NBRC 13074 / NRRL 2958 / 5647) TaxID=457429 RepID=D6X832_STRE2|nr:predicted protein [Streptomyces pristinaespiralis ATCC 25486]